ncbi:hypothetical protein [Microcoleus sp. D3_18a_C4]|uniref:hypothetical protein n=1 Tax=unclassified Microcoleus TaxID=2642155 RepID=UPI002FD00C10
MPPVQDLFRMVQDVRRSHISPLSPACLPPVSRLSPSKGKVFEGCAVARHNGNSMLDRL